MENLFLKNKDGVIFKLKHICMCDECKKRQMPELCLEDMNGNYADYIKVSDLFSGEWVLAKDYYKLYEERNENN